MILPDVTFSCADELLKDAHGIDLPLAALTRRRADADAVQIGMFEVY